MSVEKRLEKEVKQGGSGGFDEDMDYAIIPLPDSQTLLSLIDAVRMVELNWGFFGMGENGEQLRKAYEAVTE